MRVGLAVLLGLSPLLPYGSDVTAEQEGHLLLPLESATKEIIKVTDQRLIPETLTLDVPDSTIFLVNFSETSPVDVAIEFGQRRVHCHSKNIEIDAAGVMRTVEPVAPQDFTVLCLPEKGTYPYTITFSETASGSVAKRKAPLKGIVVVN